MKLKLLSFALLLGALSLTSCKKDKAEAIDEIETTFEISENQAIADNQDDDANDVLEEAAERNNLQGRIGACGNVNWPVLLGLGNCATVTVTGNFPAKNIKIDFGTGCTSANGVVRSGIVNIVLTDSLRRPGAVATTTFENYFVNGYKKEGTIARTNTSQPGGRSFNRTVTNGRITSPAGRVWTHSANVNITQTSGVATPCDINDDIFSIEGTRTATNAQGRTRMATTQTPLQKKRSCHNIDQGILQVQGTNHTAIIDFGNGTCDNLATISINGRPERTIRLR
jgi:hypothetical protein